MNWKSEAIDRLNKYPAMTMALKNIPIEINRLKLEAESIPSGSPDHIPSRSPAGPRDERLINNMIHRKELTDAYENAKLWVDTTHNALKVLSPQEETILRRMYLESGSGVVANLCLELGLEQSSIYRHRDQALYRFIMALYGVS